ncbi:MAG: hypothetical protein EHM72_15875 [Calditrichaeota bacterium]|nr:MAG: hypothetical protein EHM72_15875 [Calditrichota bacterium]
MAAVHKILLNTLESEFAQVLILPGDQAIYFAATDESIPTSQIGTLKHRYDQYRIQLPTFHPAMFITLYDSLRITSFREQLHKSQIERVNNDFKPIAYIFDFLVWYKRDHGDTKILSFYLSTLTVRIFVGMLILIVVFAGILRWVRISAKWRILTATVAVGFATMVFQFVLLLALQMFYGYIYSWLAAAMAAFMAGMSLASAIVARRMSLWRTTRALQAYVFIVVLFSLLLLPLATFVNRHLYFPGFMVVIFCAGGVSGGCFPLLCRRYQEISDSSDFGGIYAADIIGGAGAALLLCTFLIPLVGMQQTLFAASAVVLSGLLLIGER